MIPEPTADDLERDAEQEYDEYGSGTRRAWIRRTVTAERALLKINEIRNSIIGLQTVDWSEHIYPLVCELNKAGIKGMEYPEAKSNYGTMLERLVAAERERDELKTLLKNRDAKFASSMAENERHVDAVIKENEGLCAEVERLKMEIVGYQKANDLLLKGMESQADLMDGMKQKLRAGK